ncbi:MAG: cell division protein FtsI [Desulfococcus sp.]|nr:MAG: cell division protein FtsI [Desulfococcus sp.]
MYPDNGHPDNGHPVSPNPVSPFRVRLIAAFLACAFLVIAARGVVLQVRDHEKLRTTAVDQMERNITIRGKRGRILDARDREIARSISGTSVGANPRSMKDKEHTARLLARALHLPAERLWRSFVPPRNFVWVKRQVTPAEEMAVRALGLPSVRYVPEPVRHYPKISRAAQVVGITGVDGIGLEGLEFRYNAELQGREYRFRVKTDARGRRFEMPEERETVDYNGNDLRLTIDLAIQFIAEKALAAAVERTAARSGMALVMEPATGAVLAMANVPLFNPNHFAEYPRDVWRNRIVTDPFEPGSTMKIFSAVAAIEAGGCTPDTLFFCENGKYAIGVDTIHDTRAHGWLPLKDIIKFSSNIGAVKMGEMVGPDVLHDILADLGFGRRTGIECPGETAGLLASYRKWSRIDAGVISYGHGLSVSVVQLGAALSAIANDGVLMRPRLVRDILSNTGEVIAGFPPETVRRVVSVKTARAIRRMMRAVVEPGGTGTRADLEGYPVCGKTGTARKVAAGGGYSRDRHLASFIGFAPETNPRLTILVIIDEPEMDFYGGKVAAPVFREIALQTFNYLNIPPLPRRGGRRSASLKGPAAPRISHDFSDIPLAASAAGASAPGTPL